MAETLRALFFFADFMQIRFRRCAATQTMNSACNSLQKIGDKISFNRLYTEKNRRRTRKKIIVQCKFFLAIKRLNFCRRCFSLLLFLPKLMSLSEN